MRFADPFGVRLELREVVVDAIDAHVVEAGRRAVAFEICYIGLGRHGMNRQAGFDGEGDIHHAVFEPSAANLVDGHGGTAAAAHGVAVGLNLYDEARGALAALQDA